MRLTLRTLLAYMDEILEEGDALELKLKIDESETATRMVDRIRRLLNQHHLEAPSIHAEGIGRDSNSVAEYLDNTMSQDYVAEFERICIESDTHLAEVAACHQILTLVLGEHAYARPELRQRITRLHASEQERVGDVTDDRFDSEQRPTAPEPMMNQAIEPVPSPAPPIEPLADLDAPAPPAVQPSSARTIAPPVDDEDEHWTEAPDYLKRPRRERSWLPAVLAAAVAFCLAVAGLRAIGPFDRSHPLAGWLGMETTEVAQNDEMPEVEIPAGESPAAVIADAETPADTISPLISPTDSDTRADALPPADELPPAAVVADPPDAGPEDVEPVVEPVVDEPAVSGDSDVASEVEEPLVDAPSSDIESPPNDLADVPDLPADEPQPVDPPEPTTLINPLALSDTARDRTPDGTVPAFPNEIGPAIDPQDEPAVDDAVDSTATASPVEAGRMISDDQVLIRFDELEATWKRLPPRETLMTGDQILSLPQYRPAVMLPNTVQVTLPGPTSARLLTPESAGVPAVRIDYGRAIFALFAQGDASVAVHWANRSAVATLADASSMLALEVWRAHVPGTDPSSVDPHIVMRAYTLTGAVSFQMPDGLTIQIAPGQQLTMVDQGAAQLTDVTTQPAWFDESSVRKIDQMASDGLEPTINFDRSAALALREQADTRSRRVEIRSLAVCSLAYLGDFDPLLLALNDANLKAYWSEQFRTLRQVAALDPALAHDLKHAIEARHGGEAEALYRMVWGYTSDQLAEGEAKSLVTALAHPSADFRVAAIENLKEITGISSLYLPHYTETTRRSSIAKWNEKLQSGQIVYREIPEIVTLTQQNESESPAETTE